MNQTFMKERPIVPLVLTMSLPMVLSMLVNALYNIIDSYFVAKISEDAMTALSLVFPIQNIIGAVSIRATTWTRRSSWRCWACSTQRTCGLRRRRSRRQTTTRRSSSRHCGASYLRSPAAPACSAWRPSTPLPWAGRLPSSRPPRTA